MVKETIRRLHGDILWEFKGEGEHPFPDSLSTGQNNRSDYLSWEASCGIKKYFLVGVFVFNPVNSVSVYAHCYFLPSYRKMVSNTSYLLSMKWLFDESKYKKVIVKCTKKDRQVKGFCLKKGFSLEGEIKQSAAHKGLIVDELIFGITKDDFLGVENV